MWIDRRILLVGLLSLVGNVLLIGVLVGSLFARGDHAAGVNGRSVVPPVRIKSLSDEDKKRFRQAMGAHRTEIRKARQDYRAARQAAETDIAAPVFDKTKVAADFDMLLRTSSASQASTQAGLLDALGVLSPGAREALVRPYAAK